MKKLLAVVVAICVLATASALAGEEPEKGLPSIDLGSAKLKIGGLAQAYGMSVDQESDFQLTNLRLCADVKSKSEKWGGLLILNFAKFQEETDGNWLMIADAWYEVGDQLKLHAGRMSAAGGYTTPIAAINETVGYPTSDPTGSFIWGVQVEKLWGDKESGTLLLADIGGLSSATAFDDPQNWEGLEASLRLQKNLGKGNWFAGTAQWSEDYLRLALDSQFHLAENFYLRGALYWAQNSGHESNLVGGYVMAVWEPINRFEIHGMIDAWDLQAKTWEETEVNFDRESGAISVDQVKLSSSTENNIAVTLGGRVFLTKDRNLTLTGDVVIPVTDEDKDADPKVEARISYKF
ncbi:MAG: hypothetical protein WC640_03315 [Candidatus Paceibacterota bacterium]|jgi:hypothetical protein